MRQHLESSELLAKFTSMEEVVIQAVIMIHSFKSDPFIDFGQNTKQYIILLPLQRIDDVLDELQREDCSALIKINYMTALFYYVQMIADLHIDIPMTFNVSMNKALSIIREVNTIIMDGNTPYEQFESLVMAERQLMQVCTVFKMPIFVDLLTIADNHYRFRTVCYAYTLFLGFDLEPIPTFMDNYSKFKDVLNAVLEEAVSQNDVESIKMIKEIALEEGEFVSQLQALETCNQDPNLLHSTLNSDGEHRENRYVFYNNKQETPTTCPDNLSLR